MIDDKKICIIALPRKDFDGILIRSNLEHINIIKAFLNCDGNEVIIVGRHRNSEDSNLTIYNVYKAPVSDDELKFESMEEFYGKSKLIDYLNTKFIRK